MKKRKAFTLIELLIVVAIIAVLAVIIVLNLLSARDKANYARVKDDLNNLSQSVRLAYADGTVTSDVSFWVAFKADTDLAKIKGSDGKNLVSVVPTAPTGFGVSGDYYQYYIKGSTDFGFRATDKANSGQYCGYLNGALFTGSSSAGASSVQTYSKCDGS